MSASDLATVSRKTLRLGAQTLAAVAVVLTLVSGRAAAAEGKAEYLYELAAFTGIIPFDSVRVGLDPKSGEIYVCDWGRGVTVFNDRGMEIYRFGDDPRLGDLIWQAAVQDDGTIYLLSHFSQDQKARIVRCDYRGEPLGQIEITGLPEDLADFQPNRMVLRNGRFYLASDNQMQAVVTDLEGRVQGTWDLPFLLDMTEDEVPDAGLGGFAVDPSGNLLVTLPVEGKGYRISPDGRNVEPFGRRGSGPGKFGVPKGIGSDARGSVYLADQLGCKVLVYDSGLTFQQEFGTRGFRPGGLIAPGEITVAGDGTVYVSQRARRGVSVFRVKAD